MFWNTPATASTLWPRSAGTWLNLTSTRWTSPAPRPALASTLSTNAAVLWVPSTPIVFPRRSAGVRMPLDPAAMIEASAVGTTVATAATGAWCSCAKKSSGSYEMPTSARPAPTSVSASDTPDGGRGVTARPFRAKKPLSIAA